MKVDQTKRISFLKSFLSLCYGIFKNLIIQEKTMYKIILLGVMLMFSGCGGNTMKHYQGTEPKADIKVLMNDLQFSLQV
jgi:hypothetical protein